MDHIKRHGRFFVSTHFVEKSPTQLAKVLADLEFVPTRVEHHWAREHFEYTGISPKFRLPQEGEVTPTYNISIHTDRWESDGVLYATSEEVDLSQHRRTPLLKPDIKQQEITQNG